MTISNETPAATTLTRDDFKTEEEKAAELQARTPTDFENLYQEQKEENARLQAVITAGRLSKPTTEPQSAKAPVLAETVRRQLGPVTFLKLSRDEKLQSIGVDPKSVTDEYLHKLFGRGNDGSAAKDLMRTSPQRYAQLRQAALITNRFAAKL